MEDRIHSWYEEIKPKSSLWSIDLKELWRYRDLLFLFVRRDFVAVYKQTILGPLWFVIQPVLTTLMFTVIFGQLAAIPTDGLPPILFYMAGIIGWNYFADCLNKTSNTFVANAGIFGKVYFPRLVMPLSIVLSNLLKFGVQFILFMGVLLFYGLTGTELNIQPHVLLLPVLLILMAGLGLGFGLIISSLTTKYRDLQFLIIFGVQLFMYATPVVYPLSLAKEKLGDYAWITTLNPMSSVIETFKYAFLGQGSFSWEGLGFSGIFMLVVLVIGTVVFNKVEQTFMDTV